jgi:tRNA A-37 threonylcarbamoyl transferase component Bud32
MAPQTSSVVHLGNTIIKRVDRYLEYGIVERELTFLALLHGSGYTPRLIEANPAANEITMEYVGSNVASAVRPRDMRAQMDAILSDLARRMIRHNDIRPENVTVQNGRLYLIDWQWATIDEDPPATWPAGLGGRYRAGWPAWKFDDRASFERSLRLQ